MISSFFSFFVKMMVVSISTKYKNKKKLSHLSLYDLFLSLIIEGSEKEYLSYDQTKPTYLNRLHVVMDAVCIYLQDLQHGI